jgi:hypothetical protein
MDSKNIIIGALILTTAAGGIYGWQQRRRANDLEAQAARFAANAPAKRAAPRPAGDAQQGSADSKKTAASKAKPPEAPPDAPRVQMPSGTALRNLMQSPQAAQLIASQQRAMVESRYAPLFKSLDLPPDQLARFKNLLVEKQNAARDVMTVAREQGLDMRNSADRSEIQQLIQQAQADVDNSIASVIGADKLAQYQSYDQTAPQRAVVNQVAQRLSYTSESLTPAQNDQLVALLAQSAPAPGNGGPNRTFVFNAGGLGPMTIGQGVPITNDVINAAQSFLSPGQVDILRQMQAEQGDQQQLQRMLMNNGGGNKSSGGDGGSSSKSKNRSHRGSGGGGGNGN